MAGEGRNQSSLGRGILGYNEEPLEEPLGHSALGERLVGHELMDFWGRRHHVTWAMGHYPPGGFTSLRQWGIIPQGQKVLGSSSLGQEDERRHENAEFIL